MKLLTIFRLIKNIPKTSWSSKKPLNIKPKIKTLLFLIFGLFLFGIFFLGSILKGIGALVGTIGVGMVIAGYLYPNTSGEINKAVEEFEKR